MNLFDLYARIILDTSDFEKGVSKASQSGDALYDKLKKGITGIAKVSAAAV